MRRWIFQLDLERVLYGNEASTGAALKLVRRACVGDCVLTLRHASVAAGLVTEDEWSALRAALEQSETRKVRCLALVPVGAAAVATQCYGRSTQAAALLGCLGQPLPAEWLAMDRAEEEARERAASAVAVATSADHADEAVDPSLLEECEELDVPLESELLESEPFVEVEEDEEKMRHLYALTEVPVTLEAELQAYAQYRTLPLNRLRAGGACRALTVGNDRANVLRFLGWLGERAPPSLEPAFGSSEIGQWVQQYLEFLKARGLRNSSMANYTSGLINVTSYVYATCRPGEPAPVSQLLNLRQQCDRRAREQALYRRKDPNWIDWEAAQRARVKAIAAAEACGEKTSQKARVHLLRDALIVLFHTAQPPDRVGVVRKLRLGATLKSSPSGMSFELDLTAPNAHKTSAFYGPTCTSVSKMIFPWLRRYLDATGLRERTAELPYIFHPLADCTRPLSPSQWTGLVKSVFQRHAGIAVAPKTLRSSFITFLKDHTDAPAVLKSAAIAMRHKEATQGSDHYDKERNDRLVSEAVRFCEEYATKFTAEAAAAAATAAAVDVADDPFAFCPEAEEALNRKRRMAALGVPSPVPVDSSSSDDG